MQALFAGLLSWFDEKQSKCFKSALFFEANTYYSDIHIFLGELHRLINNKLRHTTNGLINFPYMIPNDQFLTTQYIFIDGLHVF